jgi:hypothetical protein
VKIKPIIKRCAVLLLFCSPTAFAQSLSNECYKHIYEATSAEHLEPLRVAIRAFESKGCPTSSSAAEKDSAPSIAGVTFLHYTQSKKRVKALEQAIVLAVARKSSETGGSVQDYVVTKIEKGGGGIILKEASKSDNTIRLNVDPKQLKEGQRVRVERDTVERNK